MKTKGNPYGCTNYTDSILPMEKWDDHIGRHKLKELLERHKAGHKVVVKLRVFCEECAACKDYWKDFRITRDGDDESKPSDNEKLDK